METFYKGINFRTRLEARWAVFYDTLGILFRYEREQLQLDGYLHPSYFCLPEQRMLVLIKGSKEDQEPLDKIQIETEAEILSKRKNGEDIYTFFGQIPIVEDLGALDYEEVDNDSAHRVFSFPPEKAAQIGVDGGFDNYHAWCECPECGSLDVQFGGRAARNKCGCVEGDRGHNADSMNLTAAYQKAREAIFGAPTFTTIGYVYLLEAGPFYKIGKAKVVDNRVKQIKLQLPYAPELIHSIETDDHTKLESYWHKRFADKRQKGEWFILTDADVEEFKSNSKMAAPN